MLRGLMKKLTNCTIQHDAQAVMWDTRLVDGKHNTSLVELQYSDVYTHVHAHVYACPCACLCTCPCTNLLCSSCPFALYIGDLPLTYALGRVQTGSDRKEPAHQPYMVDKSVSVTKQKKILGPSMRGLCCGP